MVAPTDPRASTGTRRGTAPVDRRAFLRLAMAGGGALATTALLPRLARAATRSAIVVGAGVSGLKAAADLVAAGYAVTVLEGRSRIGGRTWTRTDDGTPGGLGAGVRVDLGAAWIHGTQPANPIWALAQANGWATVATDWNDGNLWRQVGPGAEMVSDADAARTQALWERVLGDARAAADRRDRDTSMQAALDRQLALEGLSRGDEQILRYWASSEIEYDYAGSLRDLSAWWFDGDRWLGGQDDAIVAGGYRQLVDLLAAGLSIRTGAITRRVEHDGSGVRVVLASGETLEAAACIVTVPLGVLRRGRSGSTGIAFAPDLPQAHRSSIRGLRMGALNKLFLRYPERFWGGGQVVSWAPERPGRWIEWVDYEAVVGVPVLCGFNAGSYGIGIERKTDADVAAEGHGVLRTIFGTGLPSPTGFAVTRWMADPFSFGSYAHVPPGRTTGDYATLAEPAGSRVFLAGEHTTADYPNTVHGAYLSGARAAQQVRTAVE